MSSMRTGIRRIWDGMKSREARTVRLSRAEIYLDLWRDYGDDQNLERAFAVLRGDEPA